MQVYILVQQVEAEEPNVWVFTEQQKARDGLRELVSSHFDGEDFPPLPDPDLFEGDGLYIWVEADETDPVTLF